MNATRRQRAVVRLMGGLGNQLFQVAHALDLRATGIDVALDTSWFGRHGASSGRNLEADPVFGDLPVLGPVSSAMLALRATGKEPTTAGLDTTRSIGRTTVHTGYWQDAVAVARVRSELEGPLSRAAGYDPVIAAATDYVAVHVRQGDYRDPATRAFHGLTDPTQQLAIAERLRTELRVDRIEVFTDSPDAVEPHLEHRHGTALSSARTSWEVLRGLSQAQGLVMSNSSLSWWAATLAGWRASPPPVIECPRPWLAQASGMDDRLIDSRWTPYARNLT